MFTILTDVQITRRKRVHMVINENGDLQVAAPTIAEAIAWLRDQDQHLVVIDPRDEHTYQLNLTPTLQLLSSKRSPALPV